MKTTLQAKKLVVTVLVLLGLKTIAFAQPCVPVCTNGTTDGDRLLYIKVNNNPYFYFTFANGDPDYRNLTDWFDYTIVRGTQLSLEFTNNPDYGENVAAWIDKNNNDIYEASEKINELDNFAAGAIGSTNYSIDGTFPLGFHRVRVRCAYGSFNNNMDPCATYGYGHTIDFGINVAPDLTPFCTPKGILFSRYGASIKNIHLENFNTDISDYHVPYFKYESSSANVTAAGAYNLEVVSGDIWGNAGFIAWIDYNDDNTFSGPIEKLGEVLFTGANETKSISFLVPSNATGSHRCRVTYFENTIGASYDTPCPAEDQRIWGRDFTVNVSAVGISSIEEIQNSMSILPNPTISSSVLTFYSSLPIKGFISVSDLSGRLISNKVLTSNGGNVSVNLENEGLSAGSYFVQVISDNKSIAKKLMIKQ